LKNELKKNKEIFGKKNKSLKNLKRMVFCFFAEKIKETKELNKQRTLIEIEIFVY
jgi:hypothetical protein